MGRKLSERGKPPSCHPDRPYFAAGLCGPCYQAGRARSDRERTREQNRRYARKNSHKVREFQRRYAYGLEPEDFDAMVAAQQGRCAICRRKKDLCVDHCHLTNQVRALLCKICNIVTGLCDADPDYVSHLARYASRAAAMRAVRNEFVEAVDRCVEGEDLKVVARETGMKAPMLRLAVEKRLIQEGRTS